MPKVQLELLTWAFEHSSDGMLVTDLAGRIRMVNDAFVRMFGYSAEEMVGERTSHLRSVYSTAEFYQEMWSALTTHGEWKGEIVNRTKSGEEKICFLTITSIISQAGEKLGYLGVEIDLTERKQLENQLIQGEKLSAIGESVATLAHEIRNPLNGISMNIYLLEQAAATGGVWTAEERESLQMISRESKRLTALVKDVLTYARAAQMHQERVGISHFVEELRELTTHQAESAGVSVDWILEDHAMTGLFDPNLMKQVLLNLLQNAIEASQASDDARVRVVASLRSAPRWKTISSSSSILWFEVLNTGPELDQALAANFFKPFFTTKPQGLGLGLATSAKIVRQHHGIIDVQRAMPPFTTSFFIALPA